MKNVVLLILCLTFQFLLAQEKSSPEQLLGFGNEAYNAGRYKDAIAFYNQSIQKSPGFIDAYLARASAREQTKDLQGALTDYSIVIEKHPESFDALFGRANVRYKLKQYPQAKEDYLKLLDLPANETNTIYYQKSPSASGSNQMMTAQSVVKPMLFNYLGITETKLKNHKAAIQWLDSAIRLQPYTADYYVNRGIAYENSDLKKAEADYQHALKIDPNNALAMHNLGVLGRKKGKKQNEDYLERAIESDSTMLYPYLERAYQRMLGEYYRGAIEDYTKALKIEGSDPAIWLGRGIAREKMNDLKGAYTDYTKAIEVDEKYEKAWLNRGNLLSKQGRYEQAIEDYSAAITFNPDYAAAYYNRAIARERIKQYAEACVDLKHAESLGKIPDENLQEKVCK
ncbi:MAG TPA: tetratricopeptide repeat protein [Ohtaekwangia sp.]|nr:tetratricopeptide repeat protein [Ohtaekwangia sp.]